MDNTFFIPGDDITRLPPVTPTAKTLHIIFVVDNSGSMRMPASGSESRMEAVNRAFREMIPALQDKQGSVGDAFTILISVMSFNQNPEWLVKAQPVSTYYFTDIPESEYAAYYGRALRSLNACLSRHGEGIITQQGKIAAPYIMFMTDGAPTEDDPYEDALADLKENGWFDIAQRYAVLIGEDTIHDANARSAVAGFVKDEREGIIDAADATDIISAVSAKTIHVIGQMTRRNGPVDEETQGGSSSGGTTGIVDPFGKFTTGGSNVGPDSPF